MFKWKEKSVRLSTMQMLAAGFLLVIVIGGILLWLPVCNQEPIAFTDALFTSTSAVCVTGLMTVVPAAQFTLLGKVVLLVLIQIGGLGVVAVSTFFLVVIGRKITVKERVMIQETYNIIRYGEMDLAYSEGNLRCRRNWSNLFCISVYSGVWIFERNLV